MEYVVVDERPLPAGASNCAIILARDVVTLDQQVFVHYLLRNLDACLRSRGDEFVLYRYRFPMR